MFTNMLSLTMLLGRVVVGRDLPPRRALLSAMQRF